MLVYNTQEYVWPHAVVSIKRKLKGIFVNFHHFEFETLQIQPSKALNRKRLRMCKFRRAERTFLSDMNLMATNLLL